MRAVITPARRGFPVGLGKVARALVLLAILGIVAWQVSRRTAESALTDAENTGRQRLSLYESSIASGLEKFRHLPFLLSRDKDVLALLRARAHALGPVDPELVATVNGNLEAMRDAANCAVAYVLDAEGRAVASSNWREPGNFIGSTYAFRPYYRQAVQNGDGRYFGVGATTLIPGYFMSRAVRSGGGAPPSAAAADHGGLLGVVVIKVDLEPLQNDWAAGGELVLVTDEHRIAFMASRPSYKYAALAPLSAEAEDALRTTRKYRDEDVHPLDYAPIREIDAHTRIIRLDTATTGRPFLMQSLPMASEGWTIHYLTDLSTANAKTRDRTVMAVILVAALSVLFLYLRQRRANLRAQLAARDAMTDALRVARDELEQQVSVRTAELVQAGKMAALGQMSAAIAHELNQPLTALQTFVASTRVFVSRGNTEKVSGNLSLIDDLTQRMARITAQLRSFSHKSAGRREPVSLSRAVERALLLLEGRVRMERVEVVRDVPEEAVVIADEVRIEQVLVNLVRNAMDAMSESDVRHLTIRAKRGGNGSRSWILSVRDTGAGIADEHLSRVFEPFFTSKNRDEGLGLGLSLSHEIVRGFGGTIRVESAVGQGSTFVVDLPSYETPASVEGNAHA